MAHTWQVRSTQLEAYMTQSINDWAQNSANGQIPALTADATAGHFGGSKIDVRSQSGKNAIVYCGIDNLLTGAGAKFSVHLRFSPTWTGNPARAQTLFIIGDPMGSYNQGFLLRLTTASKFEVTCYDKSNNARINHTTTATHAATSGTPIDVYVVIDNTVTSNALKIYTNDHGSAATLLEQANAAATIPARDRMAMPAIGIGAGEQGLSDFYIVEANGWNDVIDPTTFGTRTDFITASAFEGFSGSSSSSSRVRHMGPGVFG